ncbi:MAG: hypothetical protein HC915_04405 [Anaerolineae bacterium]|nr:hypothetical protein [Anaerolineae bacterium]
MVDAYHPQQYGGTGLPADADVLAEAMRLSGRVMLAGGLTPQNVGAAIARYRPWAVDVASGVEQAKGKKDPTQIWAFVESVQAMDQQLGG